MTVPEKAKLKSLNFGITLGSPLVTPAGYPLVTENVGRHIDCSCGAVQSSRAPNTARGRIFFEFSGLSGRAGEVSAWRGFQRIESTEKWQTFSVTLRKVSLVTNYGYTRLDGGKKLLTAEDAENDQRSPSKGIQKRSAAATECRIPSS
jgi:hypothetical protein